MNRGNLFEAPLYIPLMGVSQKCIKTCPLFRTFPSIYKKMTY